jgi:hypothetical protein
VRALIPCVVLSLAACDGASVEVTEPVAGHAVEAGFPVDIAWTSNGEPGPLDLALVGGPGPAREIAAGVEDTGRHAWVIPEDVPEASDYRVRFRAGDTVLGDSPAFTILEHRSLTVTGPDGSGPLLPGQRVITWESTGAIGEVRIEVVAGDRPVAVVAGATADDGSAPWVIPYAAPPAGPLIVRVVDADDREVFGESPELRIAPFRFARELTLTSTLEEPATNRPVLLALPADFPYQDLRPDAADLRVVADLTGAGEELDFWLDAIAQDEPGRVWIRMPELAPGDTALYLLYGNQDASAPAGVAFEDLFTEVYQSQGDVILGGDLEHDWFELRAGHTITAAAGQILRVRAHGIVIDGDIDAFGRGHPGGGVLAPMAPGPGGGEGSLEDGGGGGGAYGGRGGRGGYDPGDTPGDGGSTYGTIDGPDLELGSGGGGAAVPGGAGGGAVVLEADHVVVRGDIDARGEDGRVHLRCSGGGAGGGVLIAGDLVDVSGQIAAGGGDGGDGQVASDDGGGGGGGGRIKIIFGAAATITGALDASGGDGGAFGSAAAGQPGQDGSIAEIEGPLAVRAVLGEAFSLEE